MSFKAGLVDEDAGISIESGEGERNVGVDVADLGWGNPGIL